MLNWEEVNDCFHSLATEGRELYLHNDVPVLTVPPSPLTFYREWVCPNRPVIINNAINEWPALHKWKDLDYLRNKIGDKSVSVAVTPNGYADAIYKGRFVMPEERKMKFNTFLDIIEKRLESNGVFYVQKQNSNLTTEFQELITDVDVDIPWASEALGKKPDAVNFWIGAEKAVTSMHKDHYENLYCVIRGEKHFILLPPTDMLYVPYGLYQAAVFKEDPTTRTFDIIEDHQTGKVPWISIDPLNPDLDAYPDFSKAQPIQCTAKAGETLYLPSLWFHHVRQSQGCIAVNFWYDMEYDIKYNYFKFMENIINLKKGTKS
ncbi:bifunctional peptidase and (3S)-lysyl hydroxylase Jmjd7 [Saccoglossus kowalevskii]|uniref:JmjC domain-containing protein 7 n=1 Tax=Saccoglossus kowalevskii TaxID=10224 RepID=A0ABM0GJU2_SACKO|nr:PREDICTED: jmjC domain-containing protein 7 [Saccoglossus kowalevskii]